MSDREFLDFVGLAAGALAGGDIDGCRAWLQKAAYLVVRPTVTEQDKAEFKQLMTRFAARDPLYRKILDPALQQVQAKPGLLQSDLTRGLDPGAAESVRYVLYFAGELGDIVRVKKGRSYQLFAPGSSLPSH